MSILIFIIILLVLVIAHELGHFLFAKRAGILVEEFGFGFPPRLFGKKIGETVYSINLLPLGGFVKIFGEDNETPLSTAEEKRSFIRKPKLVQASVLVAGIFFNLLLAWLILSGLITSGMKVSGSLVEPEKLVDQELLLTAILPSSPAELAGLEMGDQLIGVSVSNESLQDFSPEGLRNFISRHGSEEISISYEREEETGEVFVRPLSGVFGEAPAIGVFPDLVGTYRASFYRAPIEAIGLTAKLTFWTTKGYALIIKNLLAGEGKEVLAAVSGPVGIAGLVGEAANLGIEYLFLLTAFISISLAILNLIPFPALDGGRLLFLLIEAIKGSPIKPRVAQTVNFAGFALLILAFLVVTYNDIVRLIG